MTVSGEQLRALQAHFADGPPLSSSSVAADTTGGPPPVDLNVIKLNVPAQEDGPVIVTDGSARNSCTEASLRVSAGAAVATDGRMLIGWYETPRDTRSSLYAEWQAARLGLRLAARYPDGITLITDQLTVAEQIRRIVAGRPVHGVITSGVDRKTMDEIRSLTLNSKITAVCRADTRDKPQRTAISPLGRIAHAGAWLVQRLATDGLDPREHVWWLTKLFANPLGITGDKATLRRNYLRHTAR